MTARKTSVMIVEDQTMLRDSLAMAVDAQADMCVVALAADARDALGLARRHDPDLVLMDVCTDNDSSGIAATREIKQALPRVRVVIMTGMPDITFVRQAREAGADSFVYKNVGTAELLSVIRSTMDGYVTFPRAKKNVLEEAGLSEEEVAILRLVCEAKSRREIAAELYLSEGTVKRRISEILAKTGHDSIMKLAVEAVSRGYIVPSLKGR